MSATSIRTFRIKVRYSAAIKSLDSRTRGLAALNLRPRAETSPFGVKWSTSAGSSSVSFFTCQFVQQTHGCTPFLMNFGSKQIRTGCHEPPVRGNGDSTFGSDDRSSHVGNQWGSDPLKEVKRHANGRNPGPTTRRLRGQTVPQFVARDRLPSGESPIESDSLTTRSPQGVGDALRRTSGVIET